MACFWSLRYPLPPIIITIILLVLNVLERYSDSIGPDSANLNAQLNTLQFVSKMHEISIGASLSTISLSLLQYEILNGGIPIGGLLAGFRISDPGSLLSAELLATGTRGTKKFFFITLALSLLTILAAVCGPASAILMLPSLDWWEVYVTQTLESWARSATKSKLLFFIGANESLLWPMNISNANYSPYVCSGSNTSDSLSIPDGCPAGGASVIFDWARTASPLGPTTPWRWNITMPIYRQPLAAQYGSSFNRFLEGAAYPDWRFNNTQYEWFLSQTTSTPAADTIVSISRALGSGNQTTRWKLMLSDRSDPPAAQAFAACSSKYWIYQNTTGLVHSVLDGVAQLANGRLDFSGPKYTSVDMKFEYPLEEPARGFWYSNASVALNMWNASQKTVSIWADPKGKKPSIGAAMITCEQNAHGSCLTKPWTDANGYWIQLHFVES